MKQSQVNKSLRQIPGVGLSISQDLVNIGIKDIKDLIDKDPSELYDLSNAYAGCVQDRCLLYVFRCAVYYASTPDSDHETEKLKWWNWKDQPAK
ncbi:MAG TPA: helix-hairpin-helix domain-containing protein [Saprospiraceae bacterium]|nr:helix-hairpin-helix domain-containing protein [Saprospiraceae bacterium]HQW57010.1 helix-hairpin-helix domain-containing protein [Saprospiraceae bacterium]